MRQEGGYMPSPAAWCHLSRAGPEWTLEEGQAGSLGCDAILVMECHSRNSMNEGIKLLDLVNGISHKWL